MAHTTRGGARGASQIPSWRRYLSGGSLPALPVDPDTESRDRARGRYDSALGTATALGVEDAAEGDPGILSKMARALDFPGAVVRSGARELVDLFDADPETQASLDEFRTQVDERALAPDLFGTFRADDDDNIATRILKGVGSFTTEVALDPLTYVSLGGSVVGKAAAGKAVQRAVAVRAGKHLGDDVLREASERTMRNAAASRWGTVADELPEQTGQRLKEFAEATADVNVLTGATHVGDEATEHFLTGGSRGLRTFLEDTFGDAGKKIWDELPQDVQGGVRIRVPFQRDEGVRKTVGLAGGGGQFADALGLGELVGQTHRARNAARARVSRLIRTTSTALGGSHGDTYGFMISKLAEDGVQGGSLFRSYRETLESARAARAFGGQVGDRVVKAIHRSGLLVDGARKGDRKAAHKAMRHYFNTPGELDELRQGTGLYVDENIRYHVDGAGGRWQGLSDAELRGASAALLLRDEMDAVKQVALHEGLSIDDLDDYVHRALTDAAKEQGLKPAKGGVKAGTRTPGPGRTRRYFIETADGVEFRHLTPEEVNERVGYGLFEEDPQMIAAAYLGAIQTAVTRRRFYKLLRDSGVLVPDLAEFGVTRPSVAPRGIENARRAADEGLELAGPAANMFDRRTVARVMRESLDRTVGPEEQYRRVDAVMVELERLADRADRMAKTADWQSGAKARMRAARDAFKRAMREAETSKELRSIDEVDEASEALGLRRLDTSDMSQNVPPEIHAALAPEVAANAIERFFKARKDPGAIEEAVNRFYRPYLSMFKATATVGRGPGFHIRNLVGGSWNNFLIDSTAKDAVHSSKLVAARVKAGRDARREVAEELAERRGIALNRAERLVSEEAVSDRADTLLRERLSKTKLGTDPVSGEAVTLYDAHRVMLDQQVGWRSRAREQVETLAGGEPRTAGDEVTREHRVGLLDRFVYPDEADRRMRARAADTYDLFPNTQEGPSLFQRGANRVVNTWWVRQNVTAGQLTEDFLRGTALITGLKRYGKADGGLSAASLVRATQFDYSDLSEFEQRWMRGTLFPFYTWTRHNLPLQWRALWTEPGKMNRLTRASDAMKEAVGSDEDELVPEWMKENLGFVSSFSFGGSPLVLGVESPATDLNRFIKPSHLVSGFAAEAANALSPVISAPIELMSGRDLFTGAPIEPGKGKVAPAWYRALPDALAPTWEDSRGDVRGDAQIIHYVENTVPWAGQLDRLLSIGGEGSREGRAASDAIRQLVPIVQAATLTPRQEAGELYSRADRLNTAIDRQGAEREEQAKLLMDELGLTPEQVRLVLADEL